MTTHKEKHKRVAKEDVDILDYELLVNKILHSMAKRYGQYVFDHKESLKQDAQIALLKAKEKYDPKRGTFVTLAWLRIGDVMRKRLSKEVAKFNLTNHLEDIKFRGDSTMEKLTWEEIFPSNQIDIQAVARLACKDNLDWKMLTAISNGVIKRRLPNHMGMSKDETYRRYDELKDEMVAITNELYDSNK